LEDNLTSLTQKALRLSIISIDDLLHKERPNCSLPMKKQKKHLTLQILKKI